MTNRKYDLNELNTQLLIAENERRAKQYSLSEIVMGTIAEYERMREGYGDDAYDIAQGNSTASLPAKILDQMDAQMRGRNKLQEMLKDLKEEYTDEELMEQAETNRRHADDILQMIRSRNQD